MKTILAIDPGSEQSAWLLYEDGKPKRFGINTNQDVIGVIDITLGQVVCEMVASYGMPVGKEVFETVRWIGRFEQKTEACQMPFSVVYRKDVKVYLCNSMKAKDANVRQALIDRFGKPGTKKNPGITYGIHDDIWSALAIAVTFSETTKEMSP